MQWGGAFAQALSRAEHACASAPEGCCPKRARAYTRERYVWERAHARVLATATAGDDAPPARMRARWGAELRCSGMWQ